MRKSKKSYLLSCVLAVLFLFAVTNAYSAKISFLGGKVNVIRNGKEMKAAFQMKLESGDILKTGKMSFADISYDDGTVIKVRQNSSVTIGNQNVKDSDSLSVTGGIISAKFAKLEKKSARKLYTPTTVCAVRGTEYEVAVSDSADTKIQLSEGALALLSPSGIGSIKAGQNAEVEVGNAPRKTKSGDLEEWKTDNEAELDKNPEEQSDAFEEYLQKFESRNNEASKKINSYESKKSTAAAGGKRKIEKANKDIENIESTVEDDMYLNTAANKSLDTILNRYQQDKKDMYDKFLKIKEESNRVLEQQQRNYLAIMEVKEAYKKAYADIMNKHKSAVDEIKGSIDTEQFKRKK
ncbi:MAG: FecR domain-containing protein [Spirochaetes bacterium]|nr:FecR domain-containing protein [Spirochaetota bacterium]